MFQSIVQFCHWIAFVLFFLLQDNWDDDDEEEKKKKEEEVEAVKKTGAVFPFQRHIHVTRFSPGIYHHLTPIWKRLYNSGFWSLCDLRCANIFMGV